MCTDILWGRCLDKKRGESHTARLKNKKIYFLKGLAWSRVQRPGVIAPPSVYLCTPLGRGLVIFHIIIFFLTVATTVSLYLGEAEGKKMIKLHGCLREGMVGCVYCVGVSHGMLRLL